MHVFGVTVAPQAFELPRETSKPFAFSQASDLGDTDEGSAEIS